MPARVFRREITQPFNKEYKVIPLTKGKVTIVDASDYDWLMQFAWHAHSRTRHGCRQFYAVRAMTNFSGVGPRQFHVWMHRVILGCKNREFADHINGDSLDNRRQNLRKSTTAQNAQNAGLCSTNTSGFKGVSFYGLKTGWRAAIRCNGKRFILGNFPTPEEAAKAYDKAAKELHGEFAFQNFK